MFSNKLAFAALAIGCLAAAAGGGYLATRQNVTPVPASAAAQSAAPPAAPAAKPVQETEGVVGDTSAKAVEPSQEPADATSSDRSASAPAPSPAASVPKRADTVQRSGPARTAPIPANAATRVAANSDRNQVQPSQIPGPSGVGAQLPTPPVPAPVPPDNPAITTRPEDRPMQEAPPPPQKLFDELVVSADSVIGLQTETPLSSERARVEDRVEARVSRDVRAGDRVAIPAGSRAIGSVTLVERGGKFKERARLGIRFHTLVLADGTRIPISTDTIYREGEAPGNRSAAKVGGGAVVGTILGAIIGGGKGAVIGGAAGAGAGTAATAAGDRSAATIRPGEPLTVRLLSPVTVTVEQK